MRRLLPVLLVLLAAAPPALAKPWHAESDETTRAQWLSAPDGTGPGGTWTARFRILGRQDTRPVVAVVDRATGAKRGFWAKAVAGQDGVWAANVRFPRAGTYAVELDGFDALDPDRVHTLGPPVVIGPGAAPGAPLPGDTGIPWWPFALAAAAAAIVALATRARPGAWWPRGGLSGG